jgi:hypothetical protein
VRRAVTQCRFGLIRGGLVERGVAEWTELTLWRSGRWFNTPRKRRTHCGAPDHVSSVRCGQGAASKIGPVLTPKGKDMEIDIRSRQELVTDKDALAASVCLQ